MADERHDPGQTDSSLELPSLKSAFRRRRTTPSPTESAQRDTEITPSRHMTTRRMEPETRPEEPPVRRPRRMLRVRLPGLVAALVTGAVVGLVVVGLTAGSLRLCTAMRGTDSCGKPGILILLAIIAVAILLGSLLLRLSGVAAFGSTSFLGVGLLVVVILLVLLPLLDEWWVAIAVPAITMVTFVAAWWLTTTYAEPGERPR